MLSLAFMPKKIENVINNLIYALWYHGAPFHFHLYRR